MTQPKLVVNSDFEVKEPERPAGTDNSSDTSDSTPQEIINNGAVVKIHHLQLSSSDISNRTGKGSQLLRITKPCTFPT